MKTVDDLVERIMPILAGRPPEVQSAVLADLLAMWIAGHFANADETDALHEKLLTAHIKLVRDLVGPNQQRILEQVRKGSS
jgi:hypothetical protein